MRRLMVIVAALAMASTAAAQTTDTAAGQTAETVEARLARLEARVAELEHMLAPVMEKLETDAAVARNRTAARARMAADLEVYSREDLQQIEQLDQVANTKYGTDEAKASLAALLERYDHANRTGCALLYLGEMTEGAEAEGFLKRAIEQYGDCYYGDGVQVAPYARHVLAARYRAGWPHRGRRRAGGADPRLVARRDRPQRTAAACSACQVAPAAPASPDGRRRVGSPEPSPRHAGLSTIERSRLWSVGGGAWATCAESSRICWARSSRR